MNRHAWVLSLLCLASCLGASDHALFDNDNDNDNDGGSISTGASAGVAVSSGAVSGTDSGSGAQSSGANGGSVGASGGSPASGGSGGTGVEPNAGAPMTQGGTGPAEPPRIVNCAMVQGSVVSEVNGHCYRVNEAELTFSQASVACQQAGGHLVTIGSEAEDDFAEQLHDGEHWIGATDGRADTMAGVGTYSWVVDEPFEYSNWEDDQPNAFQVDCPDGVADEADCYEHCAFQSDEGDWNDRSCWHTIVSICEWDIEGGSGAAGAAGAAP